MSGTILNPYWSMPDTLLLQHPIIIIAVYCTVSMCAIDKVDDLWIIQKATFTYMHLAGSKSATKCLSSHLMHLQNLAKLGNEYQKFTIKLI